MMFGWFNCDAARASSRNCARNSRSPARAGSSTLIATVRFSLSSRAR